MATLQNTQAIQQLRNATGLNLVTGYPTQIASQITAVVDITPNNFIESEVKTLYQTATGTATVYATSATRETYITSFILGFIKNAACDATSIALTATISGVSSIIYRMPLITLTAQDSVIVVNLPKPLKVDRNSNITITGTFAAGTLVRSVSLFVYEKDLQNA